MVFFVIELQTTAAGEGSSIVTAFKNKADALEKFYDTAKYAVKAKLAVHTIKCVNAQGFDVVEPIVVETEG